MARVALARGSGRDGARRATGSCNNGDGARASCGRSASAAARRSCARSGFWIVRAVAGALGRRSPDRWAAGRRGGGRPDPRIWEGIYQIYDGRTGRWANGPPPRVTRHALSAFGVGGWLYTIGGCATQPGDSHVVERRRLG
jgi:hypothetical protein